MVFSIKDMDQLVKLNQHYQIQHLSELAKKVVCHMRDNIII